MNVLQYSEKLNDKSGTILILGYGRTGKSCAKWLNAHDYRCVVWDDAQNQSIDDINWQEISCVIQSPGIVFSGEKCHPMTQLAHEHQIPIMSDINLFQCFYANPCIGITGTNGKSTVTALLGHILEKNAYVAGNIGHGIMDIPEDFSEKKTCILELSSYQLEISQSIELDVGVFLNLSPDHLARHGTMVNYCEAKRRIFTQAKSLVIGIDDAWGQKLYQELTSDSRPCYGISNEDPQADIYVNQNGRVFLRGREILEFSDCYMIRGDHNRQNLAATLAVCDALALDLHTVRQSIENFMGLEHRQQVVRHLGDITYVNDSKATNMPATKQALLAYRHDAIFLILGGQAKEGESTFDINDQLAWVTKVFLIGAAQATFAAQLSQRGINHQVCGDLKTAVKEATACALASASPKSVVLLSPACASFDQFKDYEDRGRTFVSLVEELADV